MNDNNMMAQLLDNFFLKILNRYQSLYTLIYTNSLSESEPEEATKKMMKKLHMKKKLYKVIIFPILDAQQDKKKYISSAEH